MLRLFFSKVSAIAVDRMTEVRFRKYYFAPNFVCGWLEGSQMALCKGDIITHLISYQISEELLSWQGGMHSRGVHAWWGACMPGCVSGGLCMAGVHGGGMPGRGGAWQEVCAGGHACNGACTQERQPPKRALRILLECILVVTCVW